jgi:hypothetical protein
MLMNPANLDIVLFSSRGSWIAPPVRGSDAGLRGSVLLGASIIGRERPEL